MTDSGSPPIAIAALGVAHSAASMTVSDQPSDEDAVMRDPGAAVELGLALLGDVTVHRHALAQPAARDLRLEVLAVVAVAHHVELRARDRLEDVEDDLDALVGLEPPHVDQPRLGRARVAAVGLALHAEVLHGDVLRRDPGADEVERRSARS